MSNASSGEAAAVGPLPLPAAFRWVTFHVLSDPEAGLAFNFGPKRWETGKLVKLVDSGLNMAFC